MASFLPETMDFVMMARLYRQAHAVQSEHPESFPDVSFISSFSRYNALLALPLGRFDSPAPTFRTVP